MTTPRPSSSSAVAETGATEGRAVSRTLSVGFVLPYGERRDGFFPDTFLGMLASVARARGHRAELVRVYYDGGDARRDAEVAEALRQWLAARDVDLVVVERLFDPAPIVAHTSAGVGRRSVLVTRADSVDAVPGITHVIGTERAGERRVRRSFTVHELAERFGAHLDRVCGAPDTLVKPRLPEPLLPVREQSVIAAGEPPRVRRKTLFGNAGCPWSADPAANPRYAGVTLPDDGSVARPGCAFCCMGGDYQKRPDDAVVADLLAQARHVLADDAIDQLVLSDQYPIRYLGQLLSEAHRLGLRPVRWLFAARCDAFLRDRQRIEAAAALAAQHGQTLELYLTGFESFFDPDLERFNKGVTVSEQLDAIAAMRAVAAAYPESFRIDDARGHSLILWHPWTSAESLGESIRTMRRHGLGGLFHDVGRNRLRLYDDLPITALAARDGALTETWERGDSGAGRKKGYNPERPWRFLDPHGLMARQLAQALRQALGPETELAQLAAVASWWALRSEPLKTDAPNDIVASLVRLRAALEQPVDAPRGQQHRAHVVTLDGGCNNGCVACPNRDAGAPSAGEARGDEPVVIAGREPTLDPELLTRIAAVARHSPVGLVTNGRRFAYRAFCDRAVAAGLSAVSLKLFGVTAAVHDAYTRDDGSFRQALQGARQLLRAGVFVELRAQLHAGNLEQAPSFADLAQTLGVRQLRVECTLDGIGLDHLDSAALAVERLSTRCAALAMPFERSPLDAGARLFAWMPGQLPDWRAVLGDRFRRHPRDVVSLDRLQPSPGTVARCTLPWRRLEISPSGFVGPCCSDYQVAPWRPDGPMRIAEAWNAPAMQAFRAALASGEAEQTCASGCPHLMGGDCGASDVTLRGDVPLEPQLDRVEALVAGQALVTVGPESVQFAPTSFCNYDCLMCEWGQRGTLADELDETFYADLEQHAASLRHLEVNGGEPLASPRFRRFLESLPDGPLRHVRLGMTTNGSYLTDKTLDALGQLPGCSLIISLNAASAETYAAVNRGLAFERVRSVLDALVARRAAGTFAGTVRYSMVLLRKNLHEVEAFAAMARRDGVGYRLMLPQLDRNGQSILTDRALMQDALDRLDRVLGIDRAEYGAAGWFKLVEGERRVLADRLARGVTRPLPDHLHEP